jgi:hypothetical protein
VPQLDERREQDDAYRQAAAWRVLLAHASSDAPAPSRSAAAAAAAALAAAQGGGGGAFGFGAGLLEGMAKQFTVARAQRGVEDSAALQRIAALAGKQPQAGGQQLPPQQQQLQQQQPGAAEEPEEPEPPRPPLFSAIVERLAACLGMKSHAAIASACRATAALAESRARAVALSRSPGERAAALGGEAVRAQLALLEARMLAVAREPGFSAAQARARPRLGGMRVGCSCFFGVSRTLLRTATQL